MFCLGVPSNKRSRNRKPLPGIGKRDAKEKEKQGRKEGRKEKKEGKYCGR